MEAEAERKRWRQKTSGGGRERAVEALAEDG